MPKQLALVVAIAGQSVVEVDAGTKVVTVAQDAEPVRLREALHQTALLAVDAQAQAERSRGDLNAAVVARTLTDGDRLLFNELAAVLANIDPVYVGRLRALERRLSAPAGSVA